MGLTFKEKCPDLRNTRVVDIIEELRQFNCKVDVYDPWATAEEALGEHGISPVSTLLPATYDGIVIAVAHDEFRSLGAVGIRALGRADCVVYDLKCVLGRTDSDLRL
jgi:UDP-N-acetyl-D-galactosamine dehydrogenase